MSFIFVYSLLITSLCIVKAVKHCQIEEECRNIIKILPASHWASIPGFSEFFFNNSRIVNVQTVQDVLFEECILRYYEMLTQDFWNEKRIMNNNSWNNALPKMDKSNLNILDLDETLIDQRANERIGSAIDITGAHFWRQLLASICIQNSKDLNFGVHRNQPTLGQEFGYVTIFRQFLMHFIHQTRQSANFIVYSLADVATIIPHLILIEYFYNYVYQFTHKEEKYKMSTFKFDYVIGRLQGKDGHGIMHKSLDTVDRLVGNLEHFENIFIVDDRAQEVWQSEYQLPNVTAKMWFFQPPPFTIFVEGCSPVYLLAQSIKLRATDEYFYALTKFMHYRKAVHDNLLQTWITYASIRYFLGSKGIFIDAAPEISEIKRAQTAE